MTTKDDLIAYNSFPGFERFDLDGYPFWVGQLPDRLEPNAEQFDVLWNMHPAEYHEIEMRSRSVKTPRWQQAYGEDYYYSGRVNRALTMPPELHPFLKWAKPAVSPVLNALLLNWYDGSLGHYIGPHRDSIENMVHGAPIVTLSFGVERTFRLRPWRVPQRERLDFVARNGAVFIMPWITNRAFTHEVVRAKGCVGRRISVTIRGLYPLPVA